MQQAGEVNFTLVDMMGRQLSASTQTVGRGKIHLNASSIIPTNLSKGMYFVKLQSEGQVQSIPVVVD